jgi:hypothetical protein
MIMIIIRELGCGSWRWEVEIAIFIFISISIISDLGTSYGVAIIARARALLPIDSALFLFRSDRRDRLRPPARVQFEGEIVALDPLFLLGF